MNQSIDVYSPMELEWKDTKIRTLIMSDTEILDWLQENKVGINTDGHYQVCVVKGKPFVSDNWIIHEDLRILVRFAAAIQELIKEEK